jgi:hypothetical protein
MQVLGSDRPAQSEFRVCFFLHYFDLSKRVTSPYGDMRPPAPTDMPQSLEAICVYEHPG